MFGDEPSSEVAESTLLSEVLVSPFQREWCLEDTGTLDFRRFVCAESGSSADGATLFTFKWGIGRRTKTKS